MPSAGFGESVVGKNAVEHPGCASMPIRMARRATNVRLDRRRLLLAPAVFSDGPPMFSRRGQASATSEFLVRGTALAPVGSVAAWRVVHDVAEPYPVAEFERRALGFAVASSPFGDFLVTDEATGTAFRLYPGEAVFTAEGVVQRRQGFGVGVGYLRIALVPTESATDAGGDRLRFAGLPFAPPPAPFELELRRVGLDAGSSFALQPSSGDTLVIVEQGEAVLETPVGTESLVTTVGSDTAYAIRSVASPARLTGQRTGTSVLIAVFV